MIINLNSHTIIFLAKRSFEFFAIFIEGVVHLLHFSGVCGCLTVRALISKRPNLIFDRSDLF